MRLAHRWGTNPQRAKWLTYHMERGIRGECLDVIAEMGTVKASEWFAPVEEALAHGPVEPFPIAMQQLHRSALAEQSARDAYLLNPTVQNRRALIAAARQHVGASRQLARSLEAIS